MDAKKLKSEEGGLTLSEWICLYKYLPNDIKANDLKALFYDMVQKTTSTDTEEEPCEGQ